MDESRKHRYAVIIRAYPFTLAALAAGLNFWAFGVEPLAVALPSTQIVSAMIASALLLLALHSWLMTSTELVRLRHDIRATPEEWADSGLDPHDVTEEGARELERRHNAHRNTTENMVHFALLVPLVAIVSPTGAATVWIVGFALGRTGHVWAYLTGRDGLRGIAMSVSLLSLYGLATYLAIALVL